MGQINNKQLLAWVGITTETCSGPTIADLSKLNFTTRISQTGTAEDSTPFGAGLGVEYTTFDCGTGCLISSSEVPYEIGSIHPAHLDTDMGRISLAYPVSVSLPGDLPGAGTYKMTTTFKSNKPTYKNGAWWMWWDGSNWVISTPGMDKSGTEGVDYHVGPVTLDGSVDLVFGPVGVTIPGGALYTEDVASVLAVEDLAAVITTEG